MSDGNPGIPLANVLRAANELVSAGFIKDYAFGGALAASAGRPKNFVRIEQLLDDAKINRELLDDIVHRYKLMLPSK
jgi:hypothetical protein